MSFIPPISTSNLARPDRETLMCYARAAFEGADITALLERRLALFHAVPHCIALCSGFWALVLAMRALALPGRPDVLMPSLTYRRLADAAAWAGLRPRFCEVDPASLACSPATMRAALAPELALLLAVHPIVGVCDAPAIAALGEECGLPVLFDAVESVFEHVGGRKIGGFGGAEVFSLHASKLLNGAEGGYLTTTDPALARRLTAMRDGTAADGMDTRLNQYHAAMALAALDGLDRQVALNRERYDAYRRLLPRLPGLQLLAFDTASPTSFKTIVVELLPGWPRSRAETLERLNGAGVLARAYYHPPLHAKAMAYPHIPAQLPLTEALAERYMLLPCGDHVDVADIERVVAMLAEIAA